MPAGALSIQRARPTHLHDGRSRTAVPAFAGERMNESVRLDVEVPDSGELVDVSGKHPWVCTLDSGRRYQ